MKEATVKLILFDQERKDNTFPIMYRITKNRLRAYVQTGYKTTSVYKENWTGEVGSWIKKEYPNSKHFNGFLISELARMQDFFVEQEKKKPNLSARDLKDRWESRNNVLDGEEAMYYSEACNMYINFLNNVGVDSHKVIERGEAHINEVERYLGLPKQLIKKLRPADFLYKIVGDIPIDQVSDYHVGKLHSYVLNDLGYYPKTYNKVMGYLKTFFDWAIAKKIMTENPFKGVTLLDASNDEILTVDVPKFYKMLEIVTRENGYTGKRKKNELGRNIYFDWLVDGFQLALFTGGRREEVVNYKWSDIILTNKEPKFIKAVDLKVSRATRRHEKERMKYKRVPIHSQLKELLYKMGYEKYKGSDNFILCPESDKNRALMMDDLSRAFSHYWLSLFPEETGITFKHLRKTYMSYLFMILGGDAPTISGHKGTEVMKRHYTDQDLIAKTAKEFKIG